MDLVFKEGHVKKKFNKSVHLSIMILLIFVTL